MFSPLNSGQGGHIRINRPVIYRLTAFLVLGLGLWSFAHQVRLPAFAPAEDLSRLDWPVRIQGVVTASEDQARFQVEGYAAGTEITIQTDGPGPVAVERTVTLVAAYSWSYLLVTLISGMFFWSVAAFVFAPRVDQPAVHLFFWISVLYGMGVLVGGVFGQVDPGFLDLLPPLLQLISLAFLPATFFHLSLAFPARTTLLETRPRLPLVFYLIATALVVWQGSAFLGYYRAPGPDAWRGLAAPLNTADGLMIIQVIAGFTVLFIRARRLEAADQRRQLRWLIFGFLLGSAPYVFFRTLPNLFGAPALFPAHFDRILEMAVPTGFVFAVVRYRFLDIDIILRRGLIYGVLAAGLVVLVVMPVLLLGPGWSEPWPGWWRVVVIGCGVTAGILYRPLHELIGRGVDRAFFRIERELEKTLRRFQTDLHEAADHEDLTERLAHGMRETLYLDHCLAVVDSGTELVTAGKGDAGAARQWWEERSASDASGMSCRVLPQLFAESCVTPHPVPEGLTEADFVAVHPLCAGGRAYGAVFLGPKATGRMFLPGDLEFLERSCGAAALRLEQIHLTRTADLERLRRRQLDELSSLKDDFLSRVAHDLRTPVTSVGWSIRNLSDGLAGELNERQREYLGSIRDAVDHLGGLVNNLLEISRLEKSVVEVECVPLDPEQAVMRAAGTVKPLAEAEDVILETVIGSHDQVKANEDKLTEVLVNLLENAVRYSPTGGKVTVSVESAGPARTRISVRDQGPGLGGLENPFARFVQGAPSPDGQKGGYGLGLTIAREYVVLMGGEISAGDHADGGALFKIDLERSEVPAGEEP
jgi:signal transduction histidine kinase